MNKEELTAQTEVNLFHFILNPSVSRELQEQAASELYRRGSKYLEWPEFAAYKQKCVDEELKQYAATRTTHDPNRVLEGLGRLFQKNEEIHSIAADARDT